MKHDPTGSLFSSVLALLPSAPLAPYVRPFALSELNGSLCDSWNHGQVKQVFDLLERSSKRSEGRSHSASVAPLDRQRAKVDRLVREVTKPMKVLEPDAVNEPRYRLRSLPDRLVHLASIRRLYPFPAFHVCIAAFSVCWPLAHSLKGPTSRAFPGSLTAPPQLPAPVTAGPSASQPAPLHLRGRALRGAPSPLGLAYNIRRQR